MTWQQPATLDYWLKNKNYIKDNWQHASFLGHPKHLASIKQVKDRFLDSVLRTEGPTGWVLSGTFHDEPRTYQSKARRDSGR